MQTLTIIIIIIITALIIAGVGYGIYYESKKIDNLEETLSSGTQAPENNITENQNQQTEQGPKKLPPPKTVIEANKKYTAILRTTVGDISLELYADKVPVTVNSFVYLTRNNFYNNTIFHRVIDGFMIQGGDPTGDGTGGPSYRFKDELFEGEYTRGTLAMANAGSDTNGSQFFIMHQDNFQLPKNYVIFGKVLNGMDVVDKIATAPVEISSSGEISKPKYPVTVKSVEIVEK